MLDLRDNGGGLLNEAVLVSSDLHPRRHDRLDRRAARGRAHVFEATGDAIDTDIPVVVLVNRGTRLGVGDRHRRAAGPRPRQGRRHAHVRQGRLPGDRARSPTAARSTSPSASTSCRAGATSAAAASRRARASRRTCRPRTTPTTRARRGADAALAGCREARVSRDAAPRARADAPRGVRSSPCSTSAAASWSREPFFARGPPARSSTAPRRRAASATSCSCGRSGRGGGHGKVVRRHRPARRRARRARGADARPRAAPRASTRARRARGARGRRATRRRTSPRARPARPADVHDRPADRARLRRRDLRRAARRRRRRASGSTSPTSPPTCARARSSTARRTGARTSVYVPGTVEPMLPEALSNEACSLVPDQDRLAVTVELDLERRARCARSAFYRSHDPLRRAARLPEVDRIFAGRRARAGAVGRAAGRRARRRRPRCRPSARAAARSRSSRSEPEFDFDARGPRDRLRAERADRVAPPDRAPDDRRQRGGGDAARRRASCRRSTACTSGPSPRASSAWSSSSPRSTSRRRRCPSTMTPQQAAERGRRDARASSTQHVRRTRPRARGAHLARAALAQAGPLRPAQPRPRGPALAALLPLHVADPPLSRPDLPPRAAGRDRRRARTRRPRRRLRRRRRVVLGSASATR